MIDRTLAPEACGKLANDLNALPFWNIGGGGKRRARWSFGCIRGVWWDWTAKCPLCAGAGRVAAHTPGQGPRSAL